MAYQATVLQVMIASPGDVAQEREVVKKVIHEWNDINASDRRLVLIPVGWDTHIAPEMNIRPQERINKILLKDCDILVGILWTRVGTPTGKAVSGTVEEIEEHIKTGKPTMLYFSSQRINPKDLDPEHYKIVQEVKQKYMDHGVINEYDSLANFEEWFRRHLAIRINEYLSDKKEEAIIHNYQNEEAFPKEEEMAMLSDEAKELLLAAASRDDGVIIIITNKSGWFLLAGETQFGGRGRVKAMWEEALEELILSELVKHGDYGKSLEISHKGWEYIDELRKEIESDNSKQ